jgi:hypothetical protein
LLIAVMLAWLATLGWGLMLLLRVLFAQLPSFDCENGAGWFGLNLLSR